MLVLHSLVANTLVAAIVHYLYDHSLASLIKKDFISILRNRDEMEPYFCAYMPYVFFYNPSEYEKNPLAQKAVVYSKKKKVAAHDGYVEFYIDNFIDYPIFPNGFQTDFDMIPQFFLNSNVDKIRLWKSVTALADVIGDKGACDIIAHWFLSQRVVPVETVVEPPVDEGENEFQIRITQLEAEKESINQELQSTCTRLQEKSDSLRLLEEGRWEEKHAESLDVISNLEKSLKQSKEINAQYREEISALETRLAEIKSQKERVDTEKYEQLKMKHEEVSGELDMKRRKIQELEGNLENERLQKEEATRQIGVLDETLEKERCVAQEKIKELENLRLRIEHFEETKLQTEEEEKARETIRSENETRITELESMVEDAENLRNEWEDLYEIEQQDKDTQKEKVSTLFQRNLELDLEIQNLKNTIARLQIKDSEK